MEPLRVIPINSISPNQSTKRKEDGVQDMFSDGKEIVHQVNVVDITAAKKLHTQTRSQCCNHTTCMANYLCYEVVEIHHAKNGCHLHDVFFSTEATIQQSEN